MNWLGFRIRKGEQGWRRRSLTRPGSGWKSTLILGAREARFPNPRRGYDRRLDRPDGAVFPFVNRPPIYDRLGALAAKQGFDEIPSRMP